MRFRVPAVSTLLLIVAASLARPTTVSAAQAPVSAEPEQTAVPTSSGTNEPTPPPLKKPTLRAGRLTAEGQREIRIDGRLSEAAWATDDSISTLVTVEPEEGGVPEGRTVVRVIAHPDEIVIGVRCYDDPAGIVSYSKARDAELDEEDNVVIVLDTFGDGRSGYVFGINPGGSRLDGLVAAEGADVNTDWNTVWEAATSQDAAGWSAEIRLPIKSLSFRKGLHRWGFNIERRVQRLQESSRWSGAKLDFEIYQTSQAGILAELPDFDFGLGLTVRPAVVSEAKRPRPGTSREYDTDFSLDASQKLGPNLTSTLTVNTDFGETEADLRQTNLTRFDILFPEKRSFFLEGSDIFEFGLGTSLESASVLPFFSRRIGLFTPEGESEGVQVPILAGGKLQGRVGGTNVGALMVATDGSVAAVGDAVQSLPPAEMGVVRIKQNVLSESSVGLIGTYGDPLDRTSWLAGADFTYRTSEFQEDKNLLAGVWGIVTDREALTGDRAAFGGRVAYPNDELDFSLTYLRVGDRFDPSLGFVHRTGHVIDFTSEYNLRPESSLYRRFAFSLSFLRALNRSGHWESYVGTVRPVDVLFESGDRVTAFVEWQGERPVEPFDVFDSPERTIELLDGSYRWTRNAIQGVLAPKRRISGEVTWSAGSFYNGELQSIEATVLLKPVSVLTVGLTLERNDASFPEPEDPEEAHDFSQYLYSGRVELNFSPNFQITSLVQYDNESRAFGGAPRLRWTYHPLGDLFLSFNHNMTRTPPPDPQRWVFESDQWLLKLQHALRW